MGCYNNMHIIPDIKYRLCIDANVVDDSLNVFTSQ